MEAIFNTFPLDDSISLPLRCNWSESYSGFILLCSIGPSLLGSMIGHLTIAIAPRYPSSLSFLALGPISVVFSFAMEYTLISKIFFCVCVLGIGTAGFTALVSHCCALSMLANYSAKETQQDGKRVLVDRAGKIYTPINFATAAGSLSGTIWADLVAEKWGWSGMSISLQPMQCYQGLCLT